MTLQIARLFLSRVLPWAPVGDPNAYYNLHWKWFKRGETETHWAGRAANTLDGMLEILQEAIRSRTTTDIYVCLSSQRMATPRVIERTGKTYMSATRSVSNAVHLRCLYIDIDVKDGAYASTADAINALVKFCNASGMPQPTMGIGSGTGGLHVYWCMDEALAPADWLPLARALAEACRQHGLMVDSQCTVDAARILRVPETHNYKTVPPTLVTLASGEPLPFDYSVAAIRAALQPYMGTSNVFPFQPGPGAAPAAMLGANADLVGGLKREARPVKIETMAPQCGFIRSALETGGADFHQPLWNLSVLLATFTEDGRANAHAMSKGHPGYDEHSTDALFDRKSREREERDLGWPSCQSIKDAGCTSCDTCPLFALRKSPLSLGMSSATPAAMSVDKIPTGYLQTPDGHVEKLVTNADGSVNTLRISSYALREATLQLTPVPTLYFTTTLGVIGETRVSIPVEIVGTKETFVRHLARQNFIVSGGEQKMFQDFIMSWIKHLQKVRHGVTATAPWGWNVGADGKISGFSYDGKVFTGTGEEPAAIGDSVTARQYTPCGDLAPWKEAAAIITDQKRPEMDVLLASAFAAPLMIFTGENGAIISAFSAESGIGKSTAMMVAQAVWGHPVTGKQDLADTPNSVIRKISQLQSLPLYWDELKGGDAIRGLVNFVFQIAQGKEKSRLSADHQQRDPGSWKTLVVGASNDSLLGFVAAATKSTTAGINRVLEFVVRPPTPGVGPTLAPSDVARAVQKLESNFGGAGRVYAEWLGKNHAEANKLVGKLQSQLHERLETTREERFWVATIATLIVGANIANRLGLTRIDERAMLGFLAMTMHDLRNTRRETTNDLTSNDAIADILHQFLGAKRARNTVVTDTMIMGPGRPGNRRGPRIVSDTGRLEALEVQLALEDQFLRVSYSSLYEWLVKAGYSSPTNYIRAMVEQWGAVRRRAAMCGSTPVATGQMSVLDLYIGAPMVKAYLGELIGAEEKADDEETAAAVAR